MIKLWVYLRAAAVVVLSLFASSVAFAQTYPTRPVTLVVPFPAGGSTDVVARITAQELGKRIGQPVIIENRPGGGTVVGALSIKNAKPDGYTLLLSTTTFYGSTLMQKTPPYDPFKDFITLVPLSASGYVMLAPASIKNLKDLTERAKGKKSDYASLGTGASAMVLAEQVKEALGLDWQEVPYKGGADAMVALIRGDVQGYFVTDVLASQYVGSSEVSLVASTGVKRSSFLTNVPTFTELGYPSIVDYGLFGVSANAETPKPIVDLLREKLAEVAKSPEMLQVLKTSSLEPYAGTLADYDKLAQSRQQSSTAILKKLGLAPK